MSNIKQIQETIKENPDVMRIQAPVLVLITDLLDSIEKEITENKFTKTKCLQSIRIIEKICDVNIGVIDVFELYAQRIQSLALIAYAKNQKCIAELILEMCARRGDIMAKINYAYMLRRHEVSNSSQWDVLEALKLLREGAGYGLAFSLVNIALIFSLNFADAESWNQADYIMKNITKDEVEEIQDWWEGLALRDDDTEGFLVVYFLLRHGKIQTSNLGHRTQLAAKLRQRIKSFPSWFMG